MPLIGTISGSNGTAQSAVSGTLVIANSPSAGFPQVPSDAVLYASGIAVVTSDLVSSGTLKSLFSAGDEGGEVFLTKPATNSTLTMGVTIDLNQNRLRVFETGGTNRGGYWDVSTLGAGVSTNLAASSASPGGSDTYVQFNDGGTTFGGDAGLTYNKTTDSLTIAGNLTGTNALVSNDLRVSRDARASKYTVGDGAYLTSSDGLSMMIAASSMELNPEFTLSVTPGQNVDVVFPFNNGSTFSIKYEDTGPTYYNALTLAPGGGEEPILTLGSSTFANNAKLLVLGSVLANGIVTASLGLSGSLTSLTDGRSYLAAGSSISITSSSNGQVSVAALPAGADTYVQFNDGGSTFGADAGLTFDKTTDSLTVAGNITGSNLRLTGDIAVVGGDLTSTAATFNLAANLATQLNIGGTTPTISIGTSTGQTTVGIATGAATVGGVATPKTVNIGTNTGGSAAVFVNIGSPTAREGNARITLHNEVLLTSGTIIGSSGGVNNTFTLISSGNIINRLDIDNSGPGHRFEVQDYLGGTEFAVNENGDAEISGNLLITGSSLSTGTTTTFNFLTTALTGTLNVGSLVNSVNIGGSLTTSSFTGEIGVAGKTNLACVVERIVNSNGGTGTVNFDLTTQGIFYVNNPAGNITANFIKVPVTNNRVITPTIIMSQSAAPATPRIVSAVQIDTVVQTINWANGVVPTGNAGKQDVFGFSLIRSGSAWKVLGQMSTYG